MGKCCKVGSVSGERSMLREKNMFLCVSDGIQKPKFLDLRLQAANIRTVHEVASDLLAIFLRAQ